MKDLLLIAVRELRERLRSKAFIGSTVFTLILMIGIIVVVVLTSDDDGPPAYTIGIAAELPRTFDDSLDVAATATGVLVDTVRLPNRVSAEAALDAGDVDAVIIDVDSVLVDNGGDQLKTVLTLALQQTQFVQRLLGAGLSDEEALDVLVPGGRVEVEDLGDPEENTGDAVGVAIAGVILLFIVISTYGQWVLIGVLEEKTNRVVELVVAAVPIRTMLAGKVLGIGILGLGQLLLLIAISLFTGITLDLFELPDAALPVALWSIVWFLLGFAFYAVINAAAGSLVSRQEDAQAAALPIGIAAVISYLATFIVVLPNPDGLASRLLSLVPSVAPIAFPARIALDAAAPWEIALGLVLMAVAIYGVIAGAARIYRGALLQSGARVRIRQAWRSARDVSGA